MDPLDLAILLLRLVLVAVLYLFLVLVMRGAARGLGSAPAAARPSPPAARASAAQLRLMVLEAGTSALRSGQVIELPEGATLGRGARAEVVIADSSVSAEHARVRRVGRAWVVADLGSTNGTLVNETLVSSETPLSPDDVLGLGSVRLKVVPR